MNSVGESLLLLLSGEGQRYVVALQAFLDESGTNPETPVLGVGGFYGSDEQWKAFRESWKPWAEGFHAKNSTHRFEQICDAIQKSQIHGVLITVGKETYKTHSTAHFKTALGNAYSVCALCCAGAICDHTKAQAVAIVLEAGQPNLGFVKRVLEDMMDSGKWNVAAVSSAKKSDFIELHSADFLSHIASSHDVPWMLRLIQMQLLKHAHITEPQLKVVSQEASRLFREARAIRRRIKKSR